jgi:flagellin-like hook-associated protein FlgL
MTSINMTSRIDLNAIRLRDRIDTLGEQLSSGRRGQTYADIGTETPKAINLRVEIGRRETYQTTIDQALSKISVTQKTLDRIGAIAEKFTAATAKLMGTGRPEEIQIQATQAEAAMVEVATLLNERLNGEYLFGGSDSRNPPIPNPEQIAKTGMGLAIKDKVASLNGSNTASVLIDTKALASSDATGTTPFSDFMSDPARGLTEPRRNVLGNDDDRIEYGIPANRNGSAKSDGETTGSWARDLLRGLASIAGLTKEKVQLGEGYTNFIMGVRKGLESATNALALERGNLGTTENRLQNTAALQSSVTTSLTLQLSDLEDVDMAKTITKFQATQTQLEASYRAMSIAQQLSLTRFL